MLTEVFKETVYVLHVYFLCFLQTCVFPTYMPNMSSNFKYISKATDSYFKVTLIPAEVFMCVCIYV